MGEEEIPRKEEEEEIPRKEEEEEIPRKEEEEIPRKEEEKIPRKEEEEKIPRKEEEEIQRKKEQSLLPVKKDIIMEGILHKKGKYSRSMVETAVKIEGSDLKYVSYKGITKSISLESIRISEDSSDITSFKIHHLDRQYEFSATDLNTKKKWIEAIEKASLESKGFQVDLKIYAPLSDKKLMLQKTVST